MVIKEATPQQSLELALVENIQRADLNPLEEAEAFQALISDFGLSQQEVADRVGKSRVAVANVVRLLRLPEKVKVLLAQGALTEGHARALLGLEEGEPIIRAAEQVVARGLNVRETEDLVRRLLAAAQATPTQIDPVKDADPDALHTRQLEAAFRTALGTKVALSRGRRGGKLVIAFFPMRNTDHLRADRRRRTMNLYADLLFTGGAVYTADPTRPWAAAVAVRAGRILAVGSAADLAELQGPSTVVTNLAGKLLLPGFARATSTSSSWRSARRRSRPPGALGRRGGRPWYAPS